MNVPYFVIGVILGYFGFDFLKRTYLMSPTTESESVIEKDINPLNDYINYDALSNSEGNNELVYSKPRNVGQHYWHNPNLSDLLGTSVYNSKKDLENEIDGELYVVNDDSLTVALPKNADECIVSINAVEFVKAMAANQETVNFSFNSTDKTFRTSSNDIVSQEIMNDIIGTHNVQEIIDESDFNANGWVQTRYYYHRVNDVYFKIETK